MKSKLFKNFLYLYLFFMNSCSGVSDSSEAAAAQQAITNSVFSNSVTNFKVNVIYEAGATPYTGNLDLLLNNTWDVTKDSYVALFQNHAGRTITVPTITNHMTAIADQGKSSWSANELLSLGKTNAISLNIGTQVNITVIFLNGTYQGNNSILGVHFTGQPFVFVFKDVVTSTGGSSTEQRYVEQATIVHEVGHAIGLVHNGLPMQSAHEDPGHMKHSSDTQCVMYWAVESSSTVLSGLSHFITGNQLNLFGAAALADGRAYHP